MGGKKCWWSNGQNFAEFNENYKAVDPRSLRTESKRKYQNNQFAKNSEKGKILNEAREKKKLK